MYLLFQLRMPLENASRANGARGRTPTTSDSHGSADRCAAMWRHYWLGTVGHPPQTPGDGLGGVINADLGKLGGCPQIGFSSNAPPHANPSGCRDNNTPVNTEMLLCTPKVRRISSVKVALGIPDGSGSDAE